MADDVMIFPDTWKEFEKQYGFYDSKQAYMYGNTRLIPSFRVQQWLDHIDHIDDINSKKQSQKNRMEQIAKMFGKELGEEFKLTYKFFNTVPVLIRGRFTESGFELIDVEKIAQTQDGMMLRSEKFIALQQLLTGEAEIVEDEE